ncbi:MAG: DUF499 domain-containing protein [Verrucomicrobiota bacterium]
MLGLKLRDEFKGERLKGTTIDFSADKATSALQKPAAEFLSITYPSVDLLHILEATQPGKSHPVVLLGGRGQGKSHLMAAMWHGMKDPAEASKWLANWAAKLNRPELNTLKFRTDFHIIAESLHQQRYKFLWDLLFERHPKGEYLKGKWMGTDPSRKTDIPSVDLLLEMFQAQPTALLLDEFQTWYDGLTDTKQYPWRKWAFNFIQLLSEIANDHPDLLVLVVSIRDNQSQAYQQLHRNNPVLVDFQGMQAKKDRQRLLLYRIFENRMNVAAADISALIRLHVEESVRLAQTPPSQHEARRAEFAEAWPYSPVLMQLLEDQVLVATEAQETRDLIRILVDLFKNRGDKSPVITAADFDITNDQGSVTSLLSSVSNQVHRLLLEKARRNLEAVRTAVKDPDNNVPHAADIISALWLRSLGVEKINGAEPVELQCDITRAVPVDDNTFAAEMALIKENSFNIHTVGNRLVFKEEENAEGKLLAHARNDKLFEKGGPHEARDVERLASELRYVIGGAEEVSRTFRVVVLRKLWQTDPWSELPETERPDRWDGRLPLIVLPEYPDNVEAVLGGWLKQHLPQRRNTLRFLLPKKTAGILYLDRDLVIYARAIHLADHWKATDGAYLPLFQTYQNSHLRPRLRELFDTFAVLDIWSFAQPDQCRFSIEKHGASGDKIPKAIHEKIEKELFVAEEFEEAALAHAGSSSSVAKFITELQEPAISGKHCIPWLGEVAAKEKVLRLCAAGKIAINVRGLKLLQANPGESEDAVWMRIKGDIGSGKDLEQTIMLLPGAANQSGGALPLTPGTPTNPSGTPPGGQPANPFTLTGQTQPAGPTFKPFGTPPKTPVNLLGEVEKWGISAATNISNVNLNVSQMTGAQLNELLKKLPDGVTYSLNLDKENQ